MPRCPTCETEYPEGLSDCPACASAGEPEEAEEEVFRCERCGERYQGGDACPACGELRLDVPCTAHPERTAAGRCVICGVAVCGDCRSASPHAYLCDVHASITVIEGWAQVYSATTEFEAQLLRENLLAEGVDAQVFSQRDRIFSVDLGELSIVRVLVPTWEYQHAVKLIREHMDTGGEVVFACPACGEAFDSGVRECTGCGSPLG